MPSLLDMTFRTMKLFLLLIALGVAEAVPLQDDTVCLPQSRPWHVRLNRGGSYCSGALIDQWWIVTSFQCSFTSSSTSIASLGEYDVTVDEGTEQHISTDLTVVHSPYRSPLHSLAMVRLSKPAQFNKYVQPVPLPSSCPQPGKTCQISGWGSTVPNQYEPPKKMKCISAPVIDDQMCRELFPMFWAYGMVCAGAADSNNCLNDNGAVMVCDGQLQGIQWYSHACTNPPDPGTYTKICQYTRWIKDVMQKNSPTLPPTLPPTTLPMEEESADGLEPDAPMEAKPLNVDAN